jgi:hypothetical protein
VTEQILDKIFDRCLSRSINESEKSNLLKMIADSPNEEQGLQDAFWAVLNSREFLFNH